MKRPFSARLLFLFSVLAVFFSCAGTPEGEHLADDYYNLAREFHRLGLYDRAKNYYLICLDREPEGRDALYNLALVYLETGNPDKALPFLEKLFSFDRNNLVIMDALGIAYSLKEEWDVSLSWYDRVLEIFPWDGTALYNSALILSDQEKPGEALERLDRLWTRDKSYRTAIALWERTEERTAEVRGEYLESAVTEDEDQKVDLMKREFTFYLTQNREDEALVLAGELKEKDPEQEGWYWFKEGELLLRQYRTEEGLTSVREAFRKGFHRESDISALAEQLAPNYRNIIREMEDLYFPENEANVN